MEKFTAWLWRRFPGNYGDIVIAGGMTAVGFAVGLPSVLAVAAFLRFSASTLLWLGAGFLLLGAVLTFLLAAWFSRDARREVNAWGRGERANPLAVLDGIARVYVAPFQVAAASVPVALVVLVPVVAWREQHGLLVGVAVGFGACLALFTTASFYSLAFDLVIRPVREEAVLAAGPVAHVPRTFGLAARLLLLVGVIANASGFLVAAVATYPTANGHQIVAAYVAAIPALLFVSAFAWEFGIAPVLSPVRDLLAGTDRVAAGQLKTAVVVTTGDELGVLAQSFNRMQAGLLERERLHAAFGSYVDPALAERLLAEGSDTFDGEAVDVTVFFADVRGFTTYSEAHTPEESVARLNELFTLTVPVLLEHGGHANKFLGDGVLAVFGVPNKVDDHADRAVDAAISIQHRVRRHFGDELRIGIGINTGPVIAGTIGGGGKLEFTLIGDTVNVAARIEELTKTTGDPILIADSTLSALSRPVAALSRGTFDIRGRTERLTLHALSPW